MMKGARKRASQKKLSVYIGGHHSMKKAYSRCDLDVNLMDSTF